MKEDQDVNGKIQSNNRKNRQVNMPMLNVVGAQNVWIGTVARDGSLTGAPGQYAAIGWQTDMVRAGAIYGMQRGQRPVSGLRLYGTKGGDGRVYGTATPSGHPLRVGRACAL